MTEKSGGRTAIVCGAAGFIGSHLVDRLLAEGYWVRGVDLKRPEFNPNAAHDFAVGDLRDPVVCRELFDRPIDEVYQLAADMGGAGYTYAGEHDADLMRSSALINLNIVELCARRRVHRVFYSSSACIYAAYNQEDPDDPDCSEDSAYPAAPGSEYGWEKLFSERLYLAFLRNHGLQVRIARFHNIYGPRGTWTGGRERAPAAICRKVAEAPEGGAIEIWGDGRQTRSFLYIDECLEGIRRLMRSDFVGPVNLGSDEMIAIDDLASLVIALSGKSLTLRHVRGPQGVRGRTSDNRLIRERLDWSPSQPLAAGMARTYRWIADRVREARQRELRGGTFGS
jgi:GDP-D-mannose 3',5'-epimerase